MPRCIMNIRIIAIALLMLFFNNCLFTTNLLPNDLYKYSVNNIIIKCSFNSDSKDYIIIETPSKKEYIISEGDYIGRELVKITSIDTTSGIIKGISLKDDMLVNFMFICLEQCF